MLAMMHAAHQSPPLDAIARRAVDAGGGSTKLGRSLGLPKTTVQSWTGSRIPAEWMVRVSAVTGIPAQELRPDLWLPAEAAG